MRVLTRNIIASHQLSMGSLLCCYNWVTGFTFSNNYQQILPNDMESTGDDDSEIAGDSTHVDLTKCAMCKTVMEEAKSLQCLHSFCTPCLEECRATIETGFLRCPVCRASTPVPANGLDGLPENPLVSSMIDKSKHLTPAKDTMCVCCESSTKLQARCHQCNGFLCNKGVEIHQTMKCLRTHKVTNLDEPHSTKADVSSAGKKPRECKKHPGQGLWFFCETCQVLICRDCTVVSHKSPSHTYVELDGVVLKHKRDILQLMENGMRLALKLDGALRITRSTRNIFDNAVMQVLGDIEKIEESAIHHIRNLCSNYKCRLQEHVSIAKDNLEACEEKLTSEHNQIQQAQYIARKLLHEGSDCDVISMYQQLIASYSMARSIDPVSPIEGLYHVAFSPNENFISSIVRIGSLTLGVEKVSKGHWDKESTFGVTPSAYGNVQNPSGLAVALNGDLIVANCDPTTPVHIYNSNGVYKTSLDKRSTNALDVLVTPCNGNIYVTTDKGEFVKVYDEHAKYLRKFSIASPSGMNTQVASPCNNENDMDSDVICLSDSSDEVLHRSGHLLLRGLAFLSSNNYIIVGEEMFRFIAIHDIEDNMITSFSVPITPYFLAVTQESFIVVSPREEDIGLYILDTHGNQLNVIRPDQSIVDSWYPSGICVSKNNEICVANFGAENKGVHCFTTSGDYLGDLLGMCEDIESPEGLVFMSDDRRVAVAEWEACTIKVFSR